MYSDFCPKRWTKPPKNWTKSIEWDFVQRIVSRKNPVKNRIFLDFVPFGGGFVPSVGQKSLFITLLSAKCCDCSRSFVHFVQFFAKERKQKRYERM